MFFKHMLDFCSWDFVDNPSLRSLVNGYCGRKNLIYPLAGWPCFCDSYFTSPSWEARSWGDGSVCKMFAQGKDLGLDLSVKGGCCAVPR